MNSPDLPRSYPAGGGGLDDKDALAYSPAGFIWNDALAHGKTVRGFWRIHDVHFSIGKIATRKGKPEFLDYYHDFISGTDESTIGCEPDIEALRPYIVTNTVGWDLNVPDVFRAAQFIKELKQFEASGQSAEPHHHLAAERSYQRRRRPVSPTPRAQVADNDLAFGQIVEAVSHSANFGRTPASLPSRTIRRTAGITSAVIARRPTSSARTPNAARSSARNTTRPVCCGRWN